MMDNYCFQPLSLLLYLACAYQSLSYITSDNTVKHSEGKQSYICVYDIWFIVWVVKKLKTAQFPGYLSEITYRAPNTSLFLLVSLSYSPVPETTWYFEKGQKFFYSPSYVPVFAHEFPDQVHFYRVTVQLWTARPAFPVEEIDYGHWQRSQPIDMRAFTDLIQSVSRVNPRGRGSLPDW